MNTKMYGLFDPKAFACCLQNENDVRDDSYIIIILYNDDPPHVSRQNGDFELVLY